MPGPTSPSTADAPDAAHPAVDDTVVDHSAVPRPPVDHLAADIRELVERRMILGPASGLPDDQPLEIVEGWGTTLVDSQGVDYLDADNAVQVVGHANPRVVEAISKQAARVQTTTRYLHRGILDYSEKLLATFPDELDTVMVTCSGSESNDLALRIVRAATNAKGMIVTRHASHGATAETAAMSPAFGGETTLGGWVRVVDAPVGDGATFVGEVAAAAAELRDSEYGLAGFIADSIFSSDGVITGTFLSEVAAVVRDAGGLVIVDEVEAGFGRLGTTLWGFDAHGVVPDVVTLGNQMGNGVPLGAVIVKRSLAASFAERGRYSTGVAGDAVSVAAAQVVLDMVMTDGLMHHARAIGDYLSLGLSLLASASDALGEIRGRGLYYGIDVLDTDGAPDGDRAVAIVSELRRRRVLIGSTGLHGNVLRIRPPLAFGIADADRMLEQLYGALTATEHAAEVSPTE